MKKKSEAVARTERTRDGPLVIIDLRDRVPGMSDDALTNLRENAQRLVVGGNERQRSAAEALLPVLDSELAVREAKALADRLERKAAMKTAASAKRARKS